MSTSFTLSPTELRELTGLVRPSAQARWLGMKGYEFDRGADGRVKVARAHALAKLGVDPKAIRASESAAEPNFGALDVTA